MGRSKRNVAINNQLNMVELEKILTSKDPKEVKMRKIAQLQCGRKKVGTLQAKSIFENYMNRRRVPFLDQILESLDDETKAQIDEMRKNMSPEDLAKFNNIDKTQFEEMLKQYAETIPQQASSSEGVPEGMVEVPINKEGEDPDAITESDLPKLNKNEFDFLNKLVNKE